MRIPLTGKLLIAAAALVLLMGIALSFLHKTPQPSPNQPEALKEVSERRQLSTSVQPTAHEDSSARPTQQQIDEGLTGLPKVPRVKVEEYVTHHNRDAASLLAAFRETGDTNYLYEAATNFAGNPQVQLAILARDVFPGERRKWLDAFKESSSGNSLANYLSAQDHFKNGQPDAAIKELLEASGKPQFTDYSMESYLGAEELSRFGGLSPMMANTAAMAAMAGDLLPELANMKGVANGILEAQKPYVNSGDAASVANLSEMGVNLADRLTTGEGGRFVINQLVGIATESIALKSLNQTEPYDFLGGKTPAQRLDELKQQKVSFRELTATLQPSFYSLPEAEQNSYIDRVKIYGEVAAMRWLQQRYGTNAR